MGLVLPCSAMGIVSWGVGVSVALFLVMLACLEAGFRVGRRESHKHSALAYEGIGVLEAAVFALLGLLLAFSFSGGMERLNSRRQLIVEEANAIGTAYLRVDLLPDKDQPEVRELFKRYVDARLKIYDNLRDSEALERNLADAGRLQNEIWTKCLTASRDDATQNSARLLLPALNAMIDVTTARRIALNTHIPTLILTLLISMTMLSGLLAGYAMSKRENRSWFHIYLYAAMVAITLYTVVDLDHPRLGLINVGAADLALKEVRAGMK